MNTVRAIAKVLFILTRITALGYLLSFFLSAIAFATGFGLNLIEQKTRFEIAYPFTRQPYLLGEYSSGYILAFLLLLALYALFFFLIGNVFRVFCQSRLFTENGIKQLKRFYTSNLVFPIAAVLVVTPFYDIDSPVAILVILHAFLGIFSYFMAAIFEQGVSLQDEQDLII